MDLSINRLKILGEEEIQRLDMKIEEYKNSNQASILDKSINDIKVQISDMSNICRDLNNDIISKTEQFELLTTQLNDNRYNYELYINKIDALEHSIQELQINNSTKETKLIEMKQHIDKLTETELKLKEQLLILNQKNEDYKLKYIEEKERIEFKIKQLEMEIKQSITTNFKLYNDFVLDVKNINVDCDNKKEINDNSYQMAFNNIKNDIGGYLMKNYHKLHGKTHPLTISNDSGFIRISNEMVYIHNKICEIKDIANSNMKICVKCNFSYINDYNWEVRDQHKKHSSDSIFKQHEDLSYKWLKENYQKILNNLITHTELLYIINQLNYDDFYKLFIDANLIDEYKSPIEFLLLIAFIGSNGTVLKLY